MALIQVNTTTMRNQISDLRALNAQLKTQLDNLASTELELAAMWAGDAKDAFRAAFNNDKYQIENFRKLITQFATAGDQIADKYDANERANVDIATKRNY